MSFNEYAYYLANRTVGGRVEFSSNFQHVDINVIAKYLDIDDSIKGFMDVSLYTNKHFTKSIYPNMKFICSYKREDDNLIDFLLDEIDLF